MVAGAARPAQIQPIQRFELSTRRDSRDGGQRAQHLAVGGELHTCWTTRSQSAATTERFRAHTKLSGVLVHVQVL